MDITILVTKILAIYLVVSGVFLIMKGRTVPHMLRDFFDHPAMTYLTGIILVFLSSMYLIQYNIWNGTWKTVITVFVWIVLIKGLAYIFTPGMLSKMVINKSRGLFSAYGLISIAIGLYLFFLLTK